MIELVAILACLTVLSIPPGELALITERLLFCWGWIKTKIKKLLSR